MTSRTTLQLTENLRRIRDRIESACARAGRTTCDVTLVAVTKYAELDWVRELVDLGITDLGESRPQQLVSRAAQLPAHVRWHLIGHLQRNKVESILPVVAQIHSADSVRLIEAISKEAQKLGLRPHVLLSERGGVSPPAESVQRSGLYPRVLLEVNVSGEKSKDGFDPVDMLAAWPSILRQESIAIEGLMTMAPIGDNVESARPVFRTLRVLRDRMVAASDGQCPLPDLSMGMSGDFEIAIEEGATLIRIGSSLFEGLVP